MHVGKQYFVNRERGISLVALIAGLVVIGLVAMVGMKVAPTYLEYKGIKGAIAKAKASGGSVREMQTAFDKNADINNINAIGSKDLVIIKDNGETEISFAYEKRIPLAANVSLLIDYAGTTAANGVNAAKAAAGAQ